MSVTSERDRNPDAIPGAPPPTAGWHRVNATTLYAEVRGSGSPILLIPGGAEDAEAWRAVAERLADHTVITYDRRGTLRSGREDWPGLGSAQHADDAAALIETLGTGPVVVFGGSWAGIIAVRLALRHRSLVRCTLVYEPGYLRSVPAGEGLQAPVNAAVRTHLERHPGDWVGAYAAFRLAADPGSGSERDDFLAPPAGKEWYARREEANAEALVRDDIPILTTELLDEGSFASLGVEVRCSHGTDSPALFRRIAEHLARLRGALPDVIEGAGHALCFQPDRAAGYIRRWSGP